MPVPLFLAEMNHTNRVGNKPILADVLTEKVKCLESVTRQIKGALFFDGFALVVAIGKPEIQTAFGGFAECYVNIVLRKGPRYKRIDVLLDGRHSIKATTRSRRSENTVRPVSRVTEVSEDVLEADTIASVEKFFVECIRNRRTHWDGSCCATWQSQ